MPFVNLEGWVLIGPGSEWFWTAVSGVVVAVTLVGLYIQLRMQRAQAAIEQIGALDAEFETESMIRSRLATAVLRRDGADCAAISDAGNRIMDFWARIGYLVQAGHLDRDLVYEWFHASVRSWWAVLGPTVLWERENQSEPDVGDSFEWLARLMAEMDARKGHTLVYDEAHTASRLPGAIASLRVKVQLAEELRAVIVRPGGPAGLGVTQGYAADADQPPSRTPEPQKR